MPVAPDRPRHIPRHAATPAAVAKAGRAPEPGFDDEIKAPGLAAMLRRRPHLIRQIAAGVIGLGVTLFVVAGVASASTSTPTRHRVQAALAAPTTSAVEAAPAGPAVAPTLSAPEPIAAKNLAAKPVVSKKKAPDTKKVISGLAANGIPNVALNAYRVAAARMASGQPSCGIDWAMLAGIGREESDHGRFAGAALHSDGTSTPRIIGPALNGVGSDYIAAPADGYALDGDAKYTHALGPMQFIPQTWARYGVDANGDGRADIFNINDAALGAARYLCAAGGNLRTQPGRVAAVLAYNHNDEYLAQVLALAQAYRTGVTVTGVPVGKLTGALPPIAAGTVLAVNPGLPTAVGATDPTKPAGSAKAGSKSGSKSGTKSTSKSTSPSTSTKHPGRPAGSTSSAPKSGTRSSAPKPGSGSSSSGSSGGSGPGSGAGGSPGGGTGSSPTPTPTPSPSCKVGIGGACLVP